MKAAFERFESDPFRKERRVPIAWLGIRNFKSFEATNVDFGALTLMVGKNSVGKSSIIQVIRILKQAIQKQNSQPFPEFPWNGKEISIGSHLAAAHIANPDAPVTFEFSVVTTRDWQVREWPRFLELINQTDVDSQSRELLANIDAVQSTFEIDINAPSWELNLNASAGQITRIRNSVAVESKDWLGGLSLSRLDLRLLEGRRFLSDNWYPCRGLLTEATTLKAVGTKGDLAQTQRRPRVTQMKEFRITAADSNGIYPKRVGVLDSTSRIDFSTQFFTSVLNYCEETVDTEKRGKGFTESLSNQIISVLDSIESHVWELRRLQGSNESYALDEEQIWEVHAPPSQAWPPALASETKKTVMRAVSKIKPIFEERVGISWGQIAECLLENRQVILKKDRRFINKEFLEEVEITNRWDGASQIEQELFYNKYVFSEDERFCFQGIENLLKSKVFHVGPVRALPRDVYEFPSYSKSVGSTGENTCAVLYMNQDKFGVPLSPFEHLKYQSFDNWIESSNYSFDAAQSGNFDRVESTVLGDVVDINQSTHNVLLPTLNKWLRHFKVAQSIEFEVIEGIGMSMKVIPWSEGKVKQKASNFTQLGIGLSQLLPIIVQCLIANAGDVVLIEQPELHLHPDLQILLADFFLRITSECDIQLIIETHSEHIVNRIRRRAAQDVSGIYGDLTKLTTITQANGKSSILTRCLNEIETDSVWPADFVQASNDEAYFLNRLKGI